MRTRLPVSGCVLLPAICLVSFASAQTNWERIYDGSGFAEGYSVRQTTDGGYIISGVTESWGHDAYLIKIDAQGDTIWTRTYGGQYDEQGNSVQQTADGGYVITGFTVSFGPAGSVYAYLVKTNSSGDTLWTRTYGGGCDDFGECVQQTADGGYVIAGHTTSFGARNEDVYLIKTNAQGDTLWTKTHGGTSADWAKEIQKTTDGGYIVAGTTCSFGPGHAECVNVYLIKTDAQGDTVWTRTYGGTSADYGYSVQQTGDGGYIVVGSTYSFGPGTPEYNNVYLVKTDSHGDTLWTRTYGGTNGDGGRSVQQTTEGGYVVTGHTDFSDTSDADVYLIRTNAQGDALWTSAYGKTFEDRGNCVQQSADGGYIIAAYIGGLGFADVYVIKTEPRPDASPIAILSPAGEVEAGGVYVPRAIVCGYNVGAKVLPVTMMISSGYCETILETLTARLDTVLFPTWTAGPMGPLSIMCFTALLGDENPKNDTLRDSILVVPPPWHDVGAIAIISPSGSVRAGDTVTPKARVKNFGNRAERYFDVRFRIGASYSQRMNAADALPAGSTTELTFPPWVAETGDWAVSCSTMLGSDADKTNDKVSSSVRVFPQSLSIAPDQSDRIEAGQSRTYRFYALIQGDTGGVVEVARPSPPPGWSVRLCNATGANDLTDTDGDGVPDLGYVAPGESGWFSLGVTAPYGTQGDTASLVQGVFLVAGRVGDRRDIADTAVLSLTLVPTFSVHNFPNPFSDHTTFVVGLPEEGRASLTVYTRAGERVCRVLANADLPAGVHLVRWDGVNDNGRSLAPGTYEYLLDYVHAGKTNHIRKKLVLTRQ